MSSQNIPDEEQEEPKIIVEDKRFNRDEIFSETLVSTEEEKTLEEKPSTEPSKVSEEKTASAEEVKKPTEEEEANEPKLVSVFSLGVDGYLKQSLGVLLNFAYVYLGLIANPETGILTPDISKAKLSIDTIDFIMEKLKSSFTKQEQAELTRLIRDLKVNFLNKVSASVNTVVENKKAGG